MTDQVAPLGPFETREQAQDHPSVRAIYEACNREPRRRGVLDEGNHRLYCETLTAAGVEIGAYEHGLIGRRVLPDEPHVVVVITGWIARAYEAGRAAAERRMAEYAERRRLIGDDDWSEPYVD